MEILSIKKLVRVRDAKSNANVAMNFVSYAVNLGILGLNVAQQWIRSTENIFKRIEGEIVQSVKLESKELVGVII